MQIIGAGLSGLIAAHIWPRAFLYELAPQPSAAHQALLRFRSDAVANVTGIEFRRVMVRKGIWYKGEFREPNIRLANSYSIKCLGFILPERSIWNLDAVERYIAPENFYEQLVDAVLPRITWNHNYWQTNAPVQNEARISTAPLPHTLSALGVSAPPSAEFLRMPITVQRFRVSSCEAFQTVYFPTSAHSVYRASITGSLLIVEHADREPYGEWEADVTSAFGLPDACGTALTTVSQTFGKIKPVDDAARKALLFHLTRSHNVFSLGRFACWRNTLLDDVVADAAVIKRLILSNSHYEGFKQ